MTPLLVTVASALAMEPAVAAIHSRVMHGRGWVWHRSHHGRRGRGLEANDLFPVVFAAATIAAIAAGAAIEGLSVLTWIGAGVTAYGVAYLVVHDLYIHERLGRLPGAGLRYIRWVADAHGVHHRTGRGPYGFLVPRVPTRTVPATQVGDGLVQRSDTAELVSDPPALVSYISSPARTSRSGPGRGRRGRSRR